MKRKSFMLATLLAGVLALTSCGVKETFDLMKNPIHVQGSVDPNFGMPLASGQVRLDELLGMLGTSEIGLDEYINQDSTTITVRYQMDQIYDSIEADNLTSSSTATRTVGKPGIATKETVLNQDTTIVYGVDITFFDSVDMPGIEPGNVAIRHLWLDFKIKIKGDCPPEAQAYVNSVLNARFDSVKISYINHFGERRDFHDPNIDNISMQINNILSGDSLIRVGIDLAEIIDQMPRHIDVSFHFDLGITEGIFDVDLTNIESVLDQIGLTKLYYWADAKVEMPLDLLIDSLPFNFPVDLGEEGAPNINAMLDSIAEGVEVDLKDANLVFFFENHMPLNLKLQGRFLDSTGVYVGGVLFDKEIGGAPVDPVTGIVSGTKNAKVDLHLDTERLEWLAKARQLEVKLALGTSRNAAGIPQYVKIRLDDYLKIKMYANLHPQVNIDIPLQ